MFTEIIFPTKPKVAPHIYTVNALSFWFKDVYDTMNDAHEILIMVKCPTCTNIFSIGSTTEKDKSVARASIYDNKPYYIRYAREHCPKCREYDP